MKSVKFLQQARGFADYAIQAASDLAASLPQSNLESGKDSNPRRLNAVGDDVWDGIERRLIENRRSADRRNELQSVMLDTRVRTERRRMRRRKTDEVEIRSFSFRA